MDKKPVYITIDGVILPPTFDPETFRDIAKFKPEEGDVIVATYPKCGTTWMQQIVGLILNNGEPFMTAEKYFSFMPFLEMTPLTSLEQMVRPRCIKTHLSFDRLNFSKESKYIFVARNPADCAVSFFHHTRFFPTYFFTDGNFDVYFELFLKGEVDWNDYFDNLLSWYEHRHEPNILFLTYESMRKDVKGTILKVAQFIGDEYLKKTTENDEEILKKILEYSSLDFMKKTVNEFWKEEFSKTPSQEFQNANPTMKNYARVLNEALQSGHKPNGEFVRSGIVGQGKITLSEEQKNKLQQRILEKTSHSDVMNLWENK